MNIELCEKSIYDLFLDSANKCKYIIPVYQRNYAWGKNEIDTLINDIFDAYNKRIENYYIGTLVTFNKGNNEYEIIDGQQRLTTIYLILSVIEEEIYENSINIVSELTYKSRKKSVYTLKNIYNLSNLDVNDLDEGIRVGFDFAKNLYKEIKIEENRKQDFNNYLMKNVKTIHYEVPKDVDLNNYFEIMNSRGEQLEKHEILKAYLMGCMKNNDGASKGFAEIWDACSQMGNYIQTTYKRNAFNNCQKIIDEDICYSNNDSENNNNDITILQLTEECLYEKKEDGDKNSGEENNDYYFQPIIDFPNFLLIVLKIFKYIEINDNGNNSADVTLNDIELLNEFKDKEINWNYENVKKFGFYLLKAKYYLDNFFVHQLTKDKEKGNPWILKKYNVENVIDHYCSLIKNDDKDHDNDSNIIIQLLSMFQVTYDTMTRKNYLFYCLYYLIKNNITDSDEDIGNYQDFLEKLAESYFYLYYMNENDSKSFDNVILKNRNFDPIYENNKCMEEKFKKIYVNGEDNENRKQIPLFIFNYLDYKLWKLYYEQIRGNYKEKDIENFFKEELGIKDWNQEGSIINKDVFDSFYFSSTRNSLEHFYPQARVSVDKESPSMTQINCLGNYAYIGSSANSSGSDWSPSAKVEHYLDSKKIDQVSISSLKFKIMMQICERENWQWKQIQEHQDFMLDILFSV